MTWCKVCGRKSSIGLCRECVRLPRCPRCGRPSRQISSTLCYVTRRQKGHNYSSMVCAICHGAWFHLGQYGSWKDMSCVVCQGPGEMLKDGFYYCWYHRFPEDR